ncbi:MAG: hypothetical protein PHG07_01700 [Lachnospiraceae bacterium]|nr:hypothetical protein [Lachnospiraceae bacterium]
MNIKLQNILFPDKDRYTNYHALFCREGQGIYDSENHCMVMSRYTICDFATYLNAISIKKWKEYTNIGKVTLELEVDGEFELVLSGYHLVQVAAQRQVFFKRRFKCEEKQKITVELPETKETLIGFEIHSFSDCCIFGGGYYAEVNEKQFNPVVLSVATTTFKKEDFIRQNLKMMKEELLSEDFVGQNIYVHVVDNGRSLDRAEVESEHIFYHPNKNVGGSGGFTRGMIESLAQSPKATNVLLMDDDVEILSESIRRTYILLLLQKRAYKNHIISGAMLCYEQMDEFHEDVGFIGGDGGQNPSKECESVTEISNIVKLEESDTDKKDSYAGWWYCCIPAKMIERNGYALPVFIRVDDTEFSLRNRAKFITMNGICLWHMGFVMKFNYFMEYYQVFRNFLIAEACNPSPRKKRIWKRFMGLLLSELLRFNYEAADLILDAVIDYLKGPAFIEQEKCQERLDAMSKRNAVMRDLDEYGNLGLDIDSAYKEDIRRPLDTLLYRLTFNGHILWPKSLLRKGPAVVAYDWYYNPQAQCLKDSVMAVNPYTKTGELRYLDKKRFNEIVKKYFAVMKAYKKKHAKVDAAYYARRKYLTSYEFWEKYLELEKYQ